MMANIKANGSEIIGKDLALISGQMEENTLVNGLMINNMEKLLILILKVINVSENILKENLFYMIISKHH